MQNLTQKAAEIPEAEQTFFAEIERRVQTALDRLNTQIDLEGTAGYSGALVRRRVIQTALHLLRLVLTYCLTDYSLRMIGLWGTVMGWGSLSKSGVRQRLCHCQKWLGVLIGQLLLLEKLSLPSGVKARVCIFDASSVSRPGSHKCDWRLHLGFDLSGARLTDIRLTDHHVGETLTHWQFQPGEICLADRIYGVPRSLGVVLAALAWFVIRIGWQNLPLQDEAGCHFAIAPWLTVQSSDPAATPAQVRVWVATPQGRFPIRLIARAIPVAKADKIRQRLRAEAKKNKRRLDERTLLAAGFVMVVSNLPEEVWCAHNILALYRFRWQIELVFKRLKGLLEFDHLRAFDPQLAQVYLLGKLLIALLLSEAEWRFALAVAETFTDPHRPVSRWRLSQLLLGALRRSICGVMTFDLIQEYLPQLRRYLCDEPRRRIRQLHSLNFQEVVYGW